LKLKYNFSNEIDTKIPSINTMKYNDLAMTEKIYQTLMIKDIKSGLLDPILS